MRDFAHAHPQSGAPGASSPPPAPGDVEQIRALAEAKRHILEQLHRQIVGQDAVIELLLTCVFAGGHALFVGVPGLAKTLLINSLAETLSLRSNRIQFTPDLMPSDVTGTDVLDEDRSTGERRFRFVPGPVFTHILLADEINRTPPKTQAALLQCMAERRVSAGGRTYELEAPYLVFATQNPIEQEGTYPLPEAQLDRFLVEIQVRYPTRDEEEEIVRRTTAGAAQAPAAVLERDAILALQKLIPRVPAAPHVVSHAVSLVRATRPDAEESPETMREYLRFGAGPRASQALILAAKARAALDGRFAASVEDVRALAEPVLRHRLVPSYRAEADGVSPDDLVAQLLSAIQP